MIAPRAGAASEGEGWRRQPGAMEKGPFSVEWLAQSSRGGDRAAAARRPYCPPGGGQGPGDLGDSRLRSEARRAGGPLVAAVNSRPPRVRPLPASPPAHIGQGQAPLAAALPEAAYRSSPPHPAEARGGPAVTSSRPRTKFSAAQLQELERSFREQRYIGAGEKRRLAAALNLSPSQIKTWFQNRRMKFKRQTQDARVEALFSGLFLPYRCYPDIATSSFSQEMDNNVSSTSTASLPPAMPSPAFLLPSVPDQSFQPVLSRPDLLFSSSPGLFCYSSVIPAMSLTQDHKRLRFQPRLPPC